MYHTTHHRYYYNDILYYTILMYMKLLYNNSNLMFAQYLPTYANRLINNSLCKYLSYHYADILSTITGICPMISY